MLAANAGGSVTLYHDNDEKLATTSTGIDVTGTVTADGLSANGDLEFTGTSRTISAVANLDIDIDSDSTSGTAALTITGNGGSNAIFKAVETGDISFYNTAGTSQSLFWDASAESLGIGTTSPASALDVTGSSGGAVQAVISDGANQGNLQLSKSSNYYGLKAGNDYGGLLFFSNSATERMRIDSSGNILFGATDTSATSYGAKVLKDGSASEIFAVHRQATDGDFIQFARGGNTSGSIGCGSGALGIGKGTGNLGFFDATIVPMGDTSGGASDNVIDLGIASRRFQDIYATNGTIQTSDANEKQDIDVISEAEQRVAVACKGLLRKFRWKSAVAEKGDDARIHFGIIAQDLQAAFEAEGLDAGRYAMFIHSTWIDEETGEERSRMGVRYSELLAFIIAAI
jgi:hypothetical protein